MLKVTCDIFRTDMGGQLAWLDVRRQTTAQGIENGVIAVDTCFVQNDERNGQQERALGQICTSLASLNIKVEQNIKDTQQINNNYALMEKRIEEKDKKLKVEFEKGIDSVTKQCESSFEEGLGNQAMVPQGSKVAVEIEVKTRVPP